MKAGDWIKVVDEVYTPPKAASRASMIEQMRKEPRIDSRKARGYVRRSCYGTVVRVDKATGLVVFKNSGTGAIEHCLPENAQLVTEQEAGG